MRVYLVRDDDGERIVEAPTMYAAAKLWKEAIIAENAPADVSELEPTTINEINDEPIITADRVAMKPTNDGGGE